MDKTIHLGIIGAGAITVNPGRHLDSLKELKETDWELTAICDVVPGLAEKVAAKYGFRKFYTDYHEMLADDDINAITINTPTNSHYQIAVDCLKAGKHVYLEKPITVNAAEMESLLKVANASPGVFVAGSNGLFERQMFMFKDMIDAGEFGDVYMVSVDRASSRLNAYGKRDNTKQRTKADNTGISKHSASHNVEWALFLLGDPKPVSVVAKAYYQEGNTTIPESERVEDDDGCIAMVLFDNNSSFTYKAFRAAPARDRYEMRVYGDKMSLEYDVDRCYNGHKKGLYGPDCIRMFKRDDFVGQFEMNPHYPAERGHAAIYRHFFDCIRRGEKSTISNGERGLVTMRIIDAIEESIRLGGKQVMLS
ncbi:MAG: Gfo/Idh/MocA family oxidoreductase [Firmicutes bacterium]|nr:Gfo/Idh/MocA family oxidoreductase [Bacillota bacterium]